MISMREHIDGFNFITSSTVFLCIPLRGGSRIIKPGSGSFFSSTMGKNGLRIISKKYAMKVVAKQFLEAYKFESH